MLFDILSGHIFRTGAYQECVLLLLCCCAAWMTGRSIASDWKPLWNLALGVLGLGIATRFLHYALYEAEFLSFSRFIVDALLLGCVAYVGFLYTRTNQMTRQYHWLYEKASLLSWRAKS